MAKTSDYRRAKNRCPARLKEVRRKNGKVDSWLCQLVNGHDGEHVTYSGHRTWEGGLGTTWNVKGNGLSAPGADEFQRQFLRIRFHEMEQGRQGLFQVLMMEREIDRNDLSSIEKLLDEIESQPPLF